VSNDGDKVDLQPRRACLDEALAVADLWLLSRRASIPQIPPPVHSDEEVRAWFQHVVFPSLDVWVTGVPGHLVALMVLDHEWIEQLYVHPTWNSRGLGSQMLELAKREHTRLDLWTFRSNAGARRFYERHGFVAVAVTDGDNEEGAPDIRYHWQRP
jgi:GNAT superfamily N-acetyltransferase